jgi:hypothetical protein
MFMPSCTTSSSGTVRHIVAISGLAFAMGTACLGSAAHAQSLVKAEVIAIQGQTPEGAASPIASVNAPFIDGNGVVAFTGRLVDTTTFVWRGTGLRFNAANQLPFVFAGPESTMGHSNSGRFVFSASVAPSVADPDEDSIWSSSGLLVRGTQPAPGLSGIFLRANSRPTMTNDGTAYWVSTYANTVGGGTVGRIFYRCSDVSNIATITPLHRTGDVLFGFPLQSGGVGFDYALSPNNLHRINRFLLTTGSAANDAYLVRDGVTIIAREGSPISGSPLADNWGDFGSISVNNAGVCVYSSSTSASASVNEVLAVDGQVGLREGATVGDVVLSQANIQATAINNNGLVAHQWSINVFEALFVGDAANLAASTRIVTTLDGLDTDNDGVANFEVRDLLAQSITGPGIALSDDGRLTFAVRLFDFSENSLRDAVVSVRLTCPADFNGDQTVDFFDYLDFVSAFSDELISADFNGDQTVDFFDYLDFVSAFANEC